MDHPTQRRGRLHRLQRQVPRQDGRPNRGAGNSEGDGRTPPAPQVDVWKTSTTTWTRRAICTNKVKCPPRWTRRKNPILRAGVHVLHQAGRVERGVRVEPRRRRATIDIWGQPFLTSSQEQIRGKHVTFDRAKMTIKVEQKFYLEEGLQLVLLRPPLMNCVNSQPM